MTPPASRASTVGHSLSSALPDYYADERRAKRRARVRHALRWAGLVAGLAGLAGAVYLVDSGR